ncbi:hypothetical protein L1987_37122 [Smallanthus sonchifolius]|uniref:Uncharacterized protein n=1 Tax=Smallanthus sonchifolius TaxID=185202 RepID=A0ACB9HFH4_9ASTR|nr:hypothetical protein L1987_37122 [Smallanthus sonchifolius]
MWDAIFSDVPNVFLTIFQWWLISGTRFILSHTRGNNLEFQKLILLTWLHDEGKLSAYYTVKKNLAPKLGVEAKNIVPEFRFLGLDAIRTYPLELLKARPTVQVHVTLTLQLINQVT